MHAAALGEEGAVLGRQDLVSVGHPAERRGVDGFGMQGLAHLRQLLRVAEQQQVAGRHGDGDRRRERELPGLVDDEQVELAACDAGGIAEVPGGAADDVAVARVVVCELTQVVFAGQGSEREALDVGGVFDGLADAVSAEAGADDRVEHVLDDGVRLRDDADAPAVVGDEPGDDVRGDIGLAGAGRALHREVRVVEPAHRCDDRVDVFAARLRPHEPTCGARRKPAQHVHCGLSGNAAGRRGWALPTRRSRRAGHWCSEVDRG
jgi:hypothetical protein